MKTITLILALFLAGCTTVQQVRSYHLALSGCENVTITVLVTSEHEDDLSPTTTAPIDVTLPISPIP